jgi:hypothetical protein
LLLVSSDYPSERIEIFDSCAHCTDKIHAVIDQARISRVDPPEALVFRGGG